VIRAMTLTKMTTVGFAAALIAIGFLALGGLVRAGLPPEGDDPPQANQKPGAEPGRGGPAAKAGDQNTSPW
jgi:hypothetical protein